MMHELLEAVVPTPPRVVDAAVLMRRAERRRRRRRASVLGVALVPTLAAFAAIGIAAPGSEDSERLRQDRPTVADQPGGTEPWDPSRSTLEPPPGWTKYAQDRRDVSAPDGSPLVYHTWRYGEPDRLREASLQLSIVAGRLEPRTLADARVTDPAATELPGLRTQPVWLIRDESNRQGLTVFEWQESPTLRVTLSFRGDIPRRLAEKVVASVQVPHQD